MKSPFGGFGWLRRVGCKGAQACLGAGALAALLIAGSAETQAREPSRSAQQVASLPRSAAPLDLGGAARPVAAWTQMCGRLPVECTVDTSEPASITLTPQAWRTLTRVNQQVNGRIRPRSDLDLWGVVDHWSYPEGGFGDCEDYQLLKRKLLAEAGLPRRAMRMTVVIDEKGEGHAVLMIRTDRGDFILDNKTNAILPWDRTGYVFVKREGQDGLGWVSLGGVSSPAATANR